jgi:hypothetical protein
MDLKQKIREAIQDKELFKKNISKLEKSTYDINQMPKGITSFPNEWKLVFVDAHLALLKHFKKKYKLRGEKARVEGLMQQLGTEKHVRISSVYSPFKILRKQVLSAKGTKEQRLPRLFQYKNKFIPLDREDLHLLALDVIENDKLLGPCRVVDLSSSTREDFGNPLGNDARMEKVFTFLEVPASNETKDDREIEKVTQSGDELTQRQIDLFNKPPDENSVDIGFKTPFEASSGIDSLKKASFAHQVRAAVLMINRAKATLKRTKDAKKKKNILSALKKWQNFKSKITSK